MSRLLTLGFTCCQPCLETQSEASFLGRSLSGKTSRFRISLQRLSVYRTGAYRLLTLFGTLSSFACYLLLVLRWRGHTSLWESLYIFPGGFGTGIVMITTFVALAAGVDETQMAIAGTGLFLSMNLGSVVGASLVSKILQASLRTGLNAGLKDFPDGQLVSLYLVGLTSNSIIVPASNPFYS